MCVAWSAGAVIGCAADNELVGSPGSRTNAMGAHDQGRLPHVVMWLLGRPRSTARRDEDGCPFRTPVLGAQPERREPGALSGDGGGTVVRAHFNDATGRAVPPPCGDAALADQAFEPPAPAHLDQGPIGGPARATTGLRCRLHCRR